MTKSRKPSERKSVALPNPNGRRPKDYSSRRQYLNALSRDNGYANYYQWQQHRKTTGTADTKHSLARRRKTLKETNGYKNYVYKFHFEQKGKFPKDVYDKNSKMIDELLLDDLTTNTEFRIWVVGNPYHKKLSAEEYHWVSTLLMERKDLISDIRLVRAGTVLEYLELAFGLSPGEEGGRGIKEVQVEVHIPKHRK